MRFRSRTLLPPEQLEALLAGYAAGEPVEALAARFGVSKGYVWHRAHVAGLGSRRHEGRAARLRAEQAELRARVEAMGVPLAEAARRLGMNVATLRYKLNKRFCGTLTSRQLSAFCRDYESGVPMEVIVQRYGIDVNQAGTYGRNLGLAAKRRRSLARRLRERCKLICLLHGQGVSIAEIAQQVGLSENYTRELLSAARPELSRSGRRLERRVTLRTVVEAGFPMRCAARAAGVHLNTAYRMNVDAQREGIRAQPERLEGMLAQAVARECRSGTPVPRVARLFNMDVGRVWALLDVAHRRGLIASSQVVAEEL